MASFAPPPHPSPEPPRPRPRTKLEQLAEGAYHGTGETPPPREQAQHPSGTKLTDLLTSAPVAYTAFGVVLGFIFGSRRR
ncbi:MULTISPECIES: hypothetical protein [Nitrospirillum]|uniref:Uncharacterized protein n=1 Tax=Nitrospirillum amazonense TaxID=28077 RepID=A0A560FJA7_9PROT|nr:hypothetical protein [Nitrospirillum amazonense]MEC4592329.1 hypothetical protein [Nitrospirillum amazonense]TWB21686.1 hypothetical protein FBZ88_11740 [Nitrospirillum amazonense]